MIKLVLLAIKDAVMRLCIGHKYSDLPAVEVMMVIQLWLTVPMVLSYVLLWWVY